MVDRFEENQHLADRILAAVHEAQPEWNIKVHCAFTTEEFVNAEETAVTVVVECYPGNIVVVKDDGTTTSGFKTKYALGVMDIKDAPELVVKELRKQIRQMVDGPVPFGFGIDHAREFDSWENEGGNGNYRA